MCPADVRTRALLARLLTSRLHYGMLINYGMLITLKRDWFVDD